MNHVTRADFPMMMMASATDSSARHLGDLLPWLILLIGLIVAGGVLIYVVKRWMAHHAASSASAGFTLQDLRDMHARGELSDEEYANARAAMIGRMKSDAPKQPDTQS